MLDSALQFMRRVTDMDNNQVILSILTRNQIVPKLIDLLGFEPPYEFSSTETTATPITIGPESFTGVEPKHQKIITWILSNIVVDDPAALCDNGEFETVIRDPARLKPGWEWNGEGWAPGDLSHLAILLALAQAFPTKLKLWQNVLWIIHNITSGHVPNMFIYLVEKGCLELLL